MKGGLKMSERKGASVERALQTFNELDRKIAHFSEILGVIHWDLQTKAPRKGKPLRSQAQGTLAKEVFQLSLSEDMGKCLNILSEPHVFAQLDEVTRAKVREHKRHYDKSKKIPPDEYQQFSILTAQAHDVWEEAKQKKDFSHFEPALRKIVDFQKRFIEYYGYEGHPYDALLDDYEPGFTVEKLDGLFAELRLKTVDLLKRIQRAADQPRAHIFNHPFDVHKQKAFSLYVLRHLGFDLEAGRLDESAHPFATGLNTQDVRITTRYAQNDMRSAIFGTIHECGHALYEQGIHPDFEGTILREGASMGIHESQSRLMENMIGRSKAFWTFFYAELQRTFPEALGHVELDDFLRAVNAVEPSLIRVEADELTYHLHIIVRYEIEKALIGGDIDVSDLPHVWHDKMEKYLGVTPENDAVGVLQDVHWSLGSFGYFPSYALGNLYAAQFLHQIKKDIPDFYANIESGNFRPIREWLRNEIHQYGKLYSPAELIKKVTGEELNAAYLTDYLVDKFTEVYRLPEK